MKRSRAAAELRSAEAEGSALARRLCIEKKEAQKKVDEQNKELAVRLSTERMKEATQHVKKNRQAELAMKRISAAEEASEKARMRAVVKLTVHKLFFVPLYNLTYCDNRYRWKRWARAK